MTRQRAPVLPSPIAAGRAAVLVVPMLHPLRLGMIGGRHHSIVPAPTASLLHPVAP